MYIFIRVCVYVFVYADKCLQDFMAGVLSKKRNFILCTSVVYIIARNIPFYNWIIIIKYSVDVENKIGTSRRTARPSPHTLPPRPSPPPALGSFGKIPPGWQASILFTQGPGHLLHTPDCESLLMEKELWLWFPADVEFSEDNSS